MFRVAQLFPAMVEMVTTILLSFAMGPLLDLWALSELVNCTQPMQRLLNIYPNNETSIWNRLEVKAWGFVAFCRTLQVGCFVSLLNIFFNNNCANCFENYYGCRYQNLEGVLMEVNCQRITQFISTANMRLLFIKVGSHMCQLSINDFMLRGFVSLCNILEWTLSNILQQMFV